MSVDSGSVSERLLGEAHERVMWRKVQESIHTVCMAIDLSDDRDCTTELLDALTLLCTVRERLRAAADQAG